MVLPLSEFETIDGSVSCGDFGGAVLNVEMSEGEARLFVVHVFKAWSLLEDELVQFRIVHGNGAPRKTNPAAVFLLGDAYDFDVGVVEELSIGVLLLADMKPDFVVILLVNADGADARLIFVGRCKEERTGFFEEVSDFVDSVNFPVMLRFEFPVAGGAGDGVERTRPPALTGMVAGGCGDGKNACVSEERQLFSHGYCSLLIFNGLFLTRKQILESFDCTFCAFSDGFDTFSDGFAYGFGAIDEELTGAFQDLEDGSQRGFKD